LTLAIEPPHQSADGLSTADLTLRQVIQSIPREYFEKDPVKAWRAVAITVVAVIAGYSAVALSPWFLLPFAWFFAGTALTGLFVIGHDCGHGSFSNRRWVNNWVGHIVMLPLIYPFHSWRILHNIHHRHTNNLDIDNAWAPWTEDEFQNASPFMQGVYRYMRGWLWWLASIAHWAALHFTLKNFNERDHKAVKRSIAAVLAFSAVFFPTLLWLAGPWGVVKFWLMPWLGYHFWMSTFTLVHHTIPDIQFRPTATWNEVEAQLSGTLHCDYPHWVEVLCHDINVHVPHHVSTGIPSYNLRAAHANLKENWGPLMRETRFSWELMSTIAGQCHLYHPTQAYRSFQDLDDA